ncbi:hypothetical protein ACTFIW_013329 [Dictyostelium discoideum]
MNYYYKPNNNKSVDSRVCQKYQQPFSEEQKVNLPVGGRLKSIKRYGMQIKYSSTHLLSKLSEVVVQWPQMVSSIILSTLSSSCIDINKFKFHYTRSAMASLLLSNNVPFHIVEKIGRWKSNDTVEAFYDKRIISEKSGGFLNTVAQI